MLQPLQVRVKRARYVSIWTHTGQTRPGPLSLLLCFRAAYLVNQRAGPLWPTQIVRRKTTSLLRPSIRHGVACVDGEVQDGGGQQRLIDKHPS
jgi:hypothetical protein